MKRTVIAFLLVLIPSISYAACSGSSPSLTAPTWADVAACHTAASSGDTITVSAGSYTVTVQTSITKYVKIVAGGGGVTLTDNVCPDVCSGLAFAMIRVTESTAGSTTFTGFTINSGTALHGNPGGAFTVSQTVGGKPVLFLNNTILDSKGNMPNWIWWGSNRGVISGLTYTGTPHMIGGLCAQQSQVLQSDPQEGASEWATAVPYGNQDTNGDRVLYFESNTINHGGIDLLGNGRVSVRHNTFNNGSVSIHGIAFSNGRFMDVGYNTFVRDNSVAPNCTSPLPEELNAFVRIGGGVALIHDNVLPDVSDNVGAWGRKNSVIFSAENLRENKGLWPCWNTRTAVGEKYPAAQQPGWGYQTGAGAITRDAKGSPQLQELEPIYVWNNTGGGGITQGSYDNPAIQDFPLGGGESCDKAGYPAPYPAATTGEPMSDSAGPYIVRGREYYLAADAPAGKPGYVPYTYPHPLTRASTTTGPNVSISIIP